MKKDYSTEFKLFIVDEALKTKNIKRFLKMERNTQIYFLCLA